MATPAAGSERTVYALSKTDLAKLIRVLRDSEEMQVTGKRSDRDIEMRIVRGGKVSTLIDDLLFEEVIIDEP